MAAPVSSRPGPVAAPPSHTRAVSCAFLPPQLDVGPETLAAREAQLVVAELGAGGVEELRQRRVGAGLGGGARFDVDEPVGVGVQPGLPHGVAERCDRVVAVVHRVRGVPVVADARRTRVARRAAATHDDKRRPETHDSHEHRSPAPAAPSTGATARTRYSIDCLAG